MIYTIVRNGFIVLFRDRGALIFSFLLPIAFFSIFGVVFGGMRMTGTPRVSVLIVDEDRSLISARVVRGLEREPELLVSSHPQPASGRGKDRTVPPDYNAATAETAVKQGVAPVALILPKGFGADPIGFGPLTGRKLIRILDDSSDPFAAQIVAGMLQKVVLSSLPDSMAAEGAKYFDRASGGLTPDQSQKLASDLARLREQAQQRDQQATAATPKKDPGGFVAVMVQDVVGEKMRSPMISFYAAGIGVFFLLFTATAAGGSLLDEAESGTLDCVLSARVSMTTLLMGKMIYCILLESAQLVLMFVWAAVIFHLDLWSHLPGFLVMTAATSFAVASFGMFLAGLARTRAQLAGFSTLIILTMSAAGGSLFPRFLMPEVMKKIGLLTFNAWAIDGYTKVFWRDEPVSHLAPQVAALAGSGIVLFLMARFFARKWESA